MAASDPITAALNLGGQLIDRFLPDPQQAAQAKLQLFDLAQKGQLAELTAQADIVRTEAASNSWLASSWRPIVMLTFTGLIVARWFGWAAPNLAQSEYLALWDIVRLGLGGYVIGRSAEKIVPSIAGAIASRNQ